MNLRDLLPPGAEMEARFDALPIAGITADSRMVKPGFLFAAVPGTKADGLVFVPQALAAGAVAVMAERAPSLRDDVAFVHVRNVREALARTAANFFPRQPATIAAITGTSGKTSVAAFTRQIWSALGYSAASVGTIGVVAPDGAVYGSLTTPDPLELHQTLDRLSSDGVTHLAIEASSHGLHQHRLDGLRVKVGAFTNITRDHLDYHQTLDAYLRAKLLIYERLVQPDGAAVIDVDHEHADAMVAAARARGLEIFTVGRNGTSVTLLETRIDGFAQIMRVANGGREYQVRLPLVGDFQVENALVAAGIALATGDDAPAVFAALASLEGAKGRLELVGERRGAPVFVDYAHKPDALAKALEALRPYTKRRLVVVLGAGGDRDQGKRPIMGAIAIEKADRVIVTDDNPRSEDPSAIRTAILAAAPGALEIGDRGAAIAQAVADLEPGDVLLIAGKGHETGQIVGNKVLPFSDQETAREAIAATSMT
ncbi:MAG: UDP-N-acetylmuramoyl-L-alanyl-D-glutamate--2,6-diaminopimelate ligase [Xanthobacteraceae bacterium]|nr:UDP-N-acetylmuramoyl-L-alanyl-D-glutamate--2,6-diaminopimelate ligase [Xanthobacteraceae bacterium]MBV9631666.1 UDP-N-acetylmuramoyl-L-alanyl-D-glutamate--2,6-diaminopimelate ligase [Xanthobacteraceae bacterium]